MMIDRRRFISKAAALAALIFARPALAYPASSNQDKAFEQLRFAAKVMRHSGMDYAAIAKRCKYMQGMNGAFAAPDYEDSLLGAARQLEQEGTDRQSIQAALLRLERIITPDQKPT